VVARTPDNPGSAREAWTRPTARVDWLAGGIESEDLEGLDAESAWLTPPPERCSPDMGFARAGYDHWRGDAHGTKLARRRSLDRDGSFLGFARTYLILKGSGLTALRAVGVDDREALRRFRAFRGRCRRLDLAVDVRHPAVTPGALYRLHQQRHFVTRLREPALWGDRDAGQTFYLLGKDQCFRAYDKTAERARKDVALPDGVTRLELELRGGWAARAFRDLSRILDAEAWDERFPRFVEGLILSKARPLDDVRPARNPQRAPVWGPLAEVLRDVRPVRLSSEELTRSAMQALAGQLLHLKNDASSLRLVRAILGDAAFLQALDRGKLDGAALALLGIAQSEPEALAAIVRDVFGTLDAPPAAAAPAAPSLPLLGGEVPRE